MSEDNKNPIEQSPDEELKGFVVVTSDKPEEAAPSPDGQAPKADGKEVEKPAGSAPAKTSDDETEDGKPLSKNARRWHRATQARDAAIQRAEEAERKLAELQQKPPDSPGSSTGKEPQIEDFETWEAYEAAKDAWDNAELTKKPVEKPSQNKPEAAKKPHASPELQAAVDDMAASFDAARGAHPDFDTVIQAKDLQISESLAILMADADNPGEVAYWLGNHKEDASRISGLSPLKQAKELEKIEAEIKTNAAPPAKRISNAPPPINPLDGNVSDQQGYHPAMTQAEFEEWDNRQNRKGNNGWL